MAYTNRIEKLVELIKKDHHSNADRGFLKDSDSLIVEWINEWIERAAQRGVWLKKTKVDASTDGYTDLASEITDFVNLHDAYWDSDGSWLQPAQNIIAWEDAISDGETGTPTHRWFRGGVLYYYPVPSSAVTDGIRIWHTYHPGDVDLTVNTTPHWGQAYDRAPVAYGLYKAFMYDRSTKNSLKLADRFLAESDDWLYRLLGSRSDPYQRIIPYRGA